MDCAEEKTKRETKSSGAMPEKRTNADAHKCKINFKNIQKGNLSERNSQFCVLLDNFHVRSQMKQTQAKKQKRFSNGLGEGGASFKHSVVHYVTFVAVFVEEVITESKTAKKVT